MKISVNENCEMILEEVYSGIGLRTEEGNMIGVCMRDDTLEINVLPKDNNGINNWWRVNMQSGTIEKMGEEFVNTKPYRELYIDAICGIDIGYDILGFVDLKGLIKFTGNQHNESWEWIRPEIEKMDDEKLIFLYHRLKNI